MEDSMLLYGLYVGDWSCSLTYLFPVKTFSPIPNEIASLKFYPKCEVYGHLEYKPRGLEVVVAECRELAGACWACPSQLCPSALCAQSLGSLRRLDFFMSRASWLAKGCSLCHNRGRATAPSPPPLLPKKSADFTWRCVFCAGSSEKEVAQAFVQLPREFPVYLWQPFARHSYYCFSEPEAQRQFSAVLGDCVRHANYGECRRSLFLYVVHPGEYLNSHSGKKSYRKMQVSYERCVAFSILRDASTYPLALLGAQLGGI